MDKQNITLIIFLLISSQFNYAQKIKTDANIIGHVVCCGKHIPFANVVIKGTTIGTVTDETGHYQLINLPVGEVTVVVTILGYKPQERIITTETNKTIEAKFELEEDILNLDEIVVSADRSTQKRTDAPVIVNTLYPKLFSYTRSVTLGEALNFSPGLRLQNNCQNCGFTQVRMNGM
ncbi:MAG: carboxypeptidase-like regulatory domain-containing protein, partial [Bacteroidales bacterium]|nr:carboxypeptidase-like regulatory domain-containing protein [Bacteroidales bacterium]